MKKTIFFALIWVATIACDKKDNVAPQLDAQTKVVPYRTATEVADVKVDLTDLKDSRCPKDVICVWSGTVLLDFKISDGKEQAAVSLEFKGDKSRDYQPFKLGGQNYVIRVSEVLPYPETSGAPKLEDYKVNVTVEKK